MTDRQSSTNSTTVNHKGSLGTKIWVSDIGHQVKSNILIYHNYRTKFKKKNSFYQSLTWKRIYGYVTWLYLFRLRTWGNIESSFRGKIKTGKKTWYQNDVFFLQVSTWTILNFSWLGVSGLNKSYWTRVNIQLSEACFSPLFLWVLVNQIHNCNKELFLAYHVQFRCQF